MNLLFKMVLIFISCNVHFNMFYVSKQSLKYDMKHATFIYV